MTDHQCRTIINKLHDLTRFLQEAAEDDTERLLLSAVLSSATLGVLEFMEANRPWVLHEADWPTVRQVYVHDK